MRAAVRLFAVLAACALALPWAASAEPIVSLGPTAGAPSAVTDGAGTLHAVWHTYEQQSGPDMLSYCRVPAGGTTCTPVILGGFPSIVVGNPQLLLRKQDGALVVVVPGNDDQARNVTFALSSGDGGTTWSAPAIVGVGQYDIDHATLTPDGSAVDTLEDFVNHMAWQRVPISSPPTPPELRIVSLTAEPDGSDTSFVFSGNVGYLPDGRPMIVAESPDVGADIRYELCGPKRNCLVYRRNEPREFGPPVVYPLALGMGEPHYLTLEPNEGGSGWMVWRPSGGGESSFATPLVTPPRGSRIGSRRIGRSRRVTVPTHYACIALGGRFVHRALVSGRRRGVTIVSVRFSFDGGQLARTDHRAPYRIVYRLPFAAGTRHVAEARVTYRLSGRTRHTSVGRAIVMCP